MRKGIAFALALLLAMTGCAPGDSFERTPAADQKPLPYICMEDTVFVGSIAEAFYRESYTIEDRLEDEALQEMVSTVELDYPIDTLDELRIFAWALYDISMEQELFDSSLLPHGAEHYCDGIWEFSFNQSEYPVSYYDGPAASFLISETDGHIITLRTEALFLDAYQTGSWQIYNGSDDLASGEQPAILRISWLDEEYKDSHYPFEERTAEDWYEDERWQEIAADIDAQYPLIESTQITDWAWELQEGAAKVRLLKSWHKPWYATHYNNGIWELIYETGTPKAPMGGSRVTVLISDTDGHVIHVEERS